MVEILKSFEQTAVWFRPIVLVLPGLGATASGLFIWLGGLGFRRLLLAVLGGVIATLMALAIMGLNPAAMVLTGLLGAFVAVLFRRFFAATLLSAQGALVTFLVVGWPYLVPPDGSLTGRLASAPDKRVLTTAESLHVVRTAAGDAIEVAKQTGRQLAASRWAIITAVAFTLLMTGLLFRQFGGAMSCALLGSALVFAGLILLLIFKGSAPVTRMARQPMLFGGAFLGMMVFGTAEQWIVCRRIDKHDEAQAPSGKKSKSRKRQTGKRTWRDR